ncbi:MAG: ribosomal RNA small subunit methyltransferase A [Chloroflexi bacterium]|nr:ribosomal RNA small subunit methyltransferase A [Chloroflexota bacterium]
MRPSKGLGQNFLVDRRIQGRILAAADLSVEDVVLEVGPGLGLLTRELAHRAGQVVAVELDRRMLAVLAETLAGLTNVHIVQGDILELDPPSAIARALGVPREELGRYKVVANLPYYITSAALRHMLGAEPRPVQMTVMVQREVAQRIVAQPGEMSLLAIGVQVFGRPHIAFPVPAGAFWPRPKVDSAVLQIDVYPHPRVPAAELEAFFRVVHAGFAHKRKQLLNSLSSHLGLPRETVAEALREAGIAPQHRAQALSIDEWLALTRALAAVEGGDQKVGSAEEPSEGS